MFKSLNKWGRTRDLPAHGGRQRLGRGLGTPCPWTKQVASDHGGTKVDMAIRSPEGIKTRGELRTQFRHVIDKPPTIHHAAGLPEPKSVKGVDSGPWTG